MGNKIDHFNHIKYDITDPDENHKMQVLKESLDILSIPYTIINNYNISINISNYMYNNGNIIISIEDNSLQNKFYIEVVLIMEKDLYKSVKNLAEIYKNNNSNSYTLRFYSIDSLVQFIKILKNYQYA